MARRKNDSKGQKRRKNDSSPVDKVDFESFVRAAMRTGKAKEAKAEGQEMIRKHKVTVWGREYEITADQLSQTVWRA